MSKSCLFITGDQQPLISAIRTVAAASFILAAAATTSWAFGSLTENCSVWSILHERTGLFIRDCEAGAAVR